MKGNGGNKSGMSNSGNMNSAHPGMKNSIASGRGNCSTGCTPMKGMNSNGGKK